MSKQEKFFQELDPCWLAGKHHMNSPLDCLTCKRMEETLKGRIWTMNICGVDEKNLLNGFRLAMYALFIHIGRNLTEDEKRLLTGIEYRFKCLIDRGATAEYLEECLSQMDVLGIRAINGDSALKDGSKNET
jgi:hypothetical protein